MAALERHLCVEALLALKVAFYKHDVRKRICGWEAIRGKRTRVPGVLMGYGAELPHDLAQYVVEAATGYDDGFWGLIARGATFRSMKRRTKPGRALIAAHRAELVRSEKLATAHLLSWRAGETTAVTQALDEALVRWRLLSGDDRLVFDWPEPAGQIERRPATR